MKNNASNRTSKINRLLASFLRPVVSILTSTRKWRWLEEKARTEIEEAAWKNFVLGRIKRFDFRRDKFRQECYSRGRKIIFEGEICYLQTNPWYQRTDSYIFKAKTKLQKSYFIKSGVGSNFLSLCLVQEVFLWYCNCQCPHQKYNSPYLIHTYKGCYEREGGEDISGRGRGRGHTWEEVLAYFFAESINKE